MCELPCVVGADPGGPGGGQERTSRARAPMSCHPLEPPPLGAADKNRELPQRSWAHGAKVLKQHAAAVRASASGASLGAFEAV